jgi:hypothetical protein
LSTLQ